MKKTLLTISVLMFLTLSFGFKFKPNTKISKSLLCKRWETPAMDDVTSKVTLTFNSDYTYLHEYVSKDNPANNKLTLSGIWSIGKDKKIYITFKKVKLQDVFEVVSMNNNELVIKTTTGVKKFEICKD